MSSLVPEGWEETNLSSLVSVDIESLKGNTDPEYKFKYIDISCVSTGSVTPPSQYILFQNAPSRAKRVVRQNDVLIATVRPNLKAFAHFDEEGEDWVASTGFAVLRNKEWADSRFIFNVMLSDDVSGQIDKLVAGSNYPAINSSDVKDLTVLSPPLPEQKKIASILTSVDEVIENTQKQIDKLQDLKKATMNQLLTKGIGHTEFKDSELGRIPKSWEVSSLGECFNLTSGKSKPKRLLSSVKTQLSKVPVYGGNGVTGYTDSELLDEQTIVIGRVGEYCGCVHLTPKLCWITDNALYIKSITRVFDLSFMFHLMVFSDLAQLQSKGGQPLVSQKPISEFVIALPPIVEQQKIASFIDAISSNIDNQSVKLSQTQSLKKSLMQDLLTGKVRVTVN